MQLSALHKRLKHETQAELSAVTQQLMEAVGPAHSADEQDQNAASATERHHRLAETLQRQQSQVEDNIARHSRILGSLGVLTQSAR